MESSEADPNVDGFRAVRTELAQAYRRDVLGLDLRRDQSGVRRADPLAFLFARFVIMVALAFAVLLVLQSGAGRWVERSDWGLFALAGLTGYTLYHSGSSWG